MYQTPGAWLRPFVIGNQLRSAYSYAFGFHVGDDCCFFCDQFHTALLVDSSKAFWNRFRSGPWFNIKMLSYQYRESHCGDKTVVRWVRWHLYIDSAPSSLNVQKHFETRFRILNCKYLTFSLETDVNSHPSTKSPLAGASSRLLLCAVKHSVQHAHSGWSRVQGLRPKFSVGIAPKRSSFIAPCYSSLATHSYNRVTS